MFEVNIFHQDAGMKDQKSKIENRTFVRGFTLVECLIALAISAILLTALAVAFNASAINYGENEDMYKTVNGARQALTRMTSQLRTGYWVDPLAAANRCNFHTAANEDISYLFNSANGTLYLITNSDGNQYVLCDNVTTAAFTKTPTDAGDDCKSVQISLTVRTGNFQRTLAAAAVIRRNLPF
jgi:prepilin-type N-terminal cleavage/methylation domain-containing protein